MILSGDPNVSGLSDKVDPDNNDPDLPRLALLNDADFSASINPLSGVELVALAASGGNTRLIVWNIGLSGPDIGIPESFLAAADILSHHI